MQQTEEIFIYGETFDRSRCKRTLQYLSTESTNDSEIILAAGRRPADPSFILRDDMKQFIREGLEQDQFAYHPPREWCKNGNTVTITTLDQKEVWGSFEETLQVVNYLKQKKCSAVTIVSGRTHIPRIWVIWKLLGSKMTIRWMPSKEAWTLKTFLVEVVKTFGMGLFALIYRIVGPEMLDKASALKNKWLNS